jgi:hypothetical protein
MSDIVSGIYEGGGAKPVSWGSEPGQYVEGTIVGIRSKQCEVFGKDGILETWPSGEPKMTPIVTVQTETFEDDDDDGKRDVYLRSNQYTAFSQALREAFKRKPDDGDVIGCQFKIKLMRLQPGSKGGNPRKIFQAKIWPKSIAGDAFDEGGGQGGETTQTAAPTQQQAPAAAQPAAQQQAPAPPAQPARTAVQPTAGGSIPF